MVNLAVLDRVLRATTKKVINFLKKKVHPRENPGYVYGGGESLPTSFNMSNLKMPAFL